MAQHTEPANDSILIKAGSKRNGFTTFLFGVSALFIAILLIALLPHSLFLVGVFALSASIVTMLIGWFKMREPPHSVELTREQLCYFHRHGQWRVDWHNIQRIDVPKISNGLQQEPLGLVGIRLKDYGPLLKGISRRLATNLLLEQRPLLLQANACSSSGCYSADLIEDDRFKAQNGEIFSGIAAMLGNRMTKLRARLGYDLYISVSELDRSTDEFVALLRQCHQQVIHHQQ